MTGKSPKTLAEIPHVWDGEILMTTVRGAADLLGVCPTTVRNWIRAGRVTGCRYLPSGRKYLPVRQLWRDEVPAEVASQIAKMREGAAALRALKVPSVPAEAVED